MRSTTGTIGRDRERVERNCEVLRDASLGALVCARPSHVLLLSGYWPVTGTALAVATADGAVGLVVPEDEEQLARQSWADEIRCFSPGSLDRLYPVGEAVVGSLRDVLSRLAAVGPIGYEAAGGQEPVSYVSVHSYGAALPELLRASGPPGGWVPADAAIERAGSVCTRREVGLVRNACAIVGRALAEGAALLGPGAVESDVAARIAAELAAGAGDDPRPSRAGGHIAVMSGLRSGHAYGSFALSSGKRLAAGELAMVHCNSVLGGFWTDVTRTFCLGEPTGRQRAMYEAVRDARDAALRAIRPGATGAEVDGAARRALEARGFGDHFKHPTGHGVGYAAIDHNAPPRLHPKSPDVLEPGMVFNVEPAIYFDGEEGMRHCDVVTCTPDGVDVLTPFLLQPRDLRGPALPASHTAAGR